MRLDRRFGAGRQGPEFLTLSPTSRFNLVAFAGEPFLYKQEMVGGMPDETARAIKWLKSYSPCNVIPKDQTKGNSKVWQTAEGQRHRGTSAKKALGRAFELKPGAIFYVSDGEPTDATPGHILDSIETWQKNLVKKATINAFAYKADGGLEFMSKLAKDNGGEFKNIK